MPLDTYNVVPQTVLDDIGGADVQRVTATSKHINTGHVQAWINRGAGKVNGVAAAEELSITTDAAIEVASIGVIAYAKARLYERLNRHDAKRDALQEYEDALDDLRAFAGEVEGGLTSASRVQSNIDKVDPKKRKFPSYNDTRADGFEGW